MLEFTLGTIVVTPGAIAELEKVTSGIAEAKTVADHFLTRHATGDWGEVDKHDANANNLALKDGSRILSAYTLSTGTKIWIITEADRSVTTILLPEEY